MLVESRNRVVRLFDGQEGTAIGPCEADRPDEPPVACNALAGCRVLRSAAA